MFVKYYLGIIFIRKYDKLIIRAIRVVKVIRVIRVIRVTVNNLAAMDSFKSGSQYDLSTTRSNSPGKQLSPEGWVITVTPGLFNRVILIGLIWLFMYRYVYK